MADASEDELEALREKRRRELAGELEAEAETETDDAAGTPDEPVYVQGATELDGVVSEHGVVLADFYADWCGPCKMLEPIVESVASETGAAVAKVDVDANQRLAARYSVQGVPTMILFVDGDPAERFVGVQDEETLVARIEQETAA